MKTKRGQAALEFLTTYGWAFLVILVMIGALAYFGVINPNKFLPERCQLTQGINCQDFQLERETATTGTVKLYLSNGMGESITLKTLTLRDPNEATGTPCDDSKLAISLGPGENTDITCTGVAGTFIEGAKTKFIVEGTYALTSGKFDRALTGDIFATVQDLA